MAKKINKFAKLVIKHSISDAIRGAFPYRKDDMELSVKEFMNSIAESYKINYSNFLINKLSTSRYDGHNGILKIKNLCHNEPPFMDILICLKGTIPTAIVVSTVVFLKNCKD